MTTTLIVRDASLAINGAPEKRGEPREHLRLRIADVAHMEARTAEECVEVLSSVSNGEGADPDVLEALVIVGLAQLMRRQGMVQDLVNRYFERARKLMREGRNNEAAGWLREVLQLDPSRKDAARLIRDLRFKRAGSRRRRGNGGAGLRFIAV